MQEAGEILCKPKRRGSKKKYNISKEEGPMRSPTLYLVSILAPLMLAAQFLGMNEVAPQLHEEEIGALPQGGKELPSEELSTCPLENILSHTGKRLDEFVSNVNQITATEVLVHERLDKDGKAKKSQRRKFNYVVLVKETKRGEVTIEEFRNGMPGNFGFPDEMAATGMPALAMVFHSDHRKEFDMACGGSLTWHNRQVWPVQFRQKKDQPARMCLLKTATREYPVPLMGTAMIDSRSYQIVHLESDLVAPIPEVRLLKEHQVLDYGPVWFERGSLTLWLPREADIVLDSNGKHFHQRHTFTDFRLFAVDYGQQISVPEATLPGTIPSAPNSSPN